MFKLLLLIALIPALALGFTPFRPCAGINAAIQVRVADCTASPCIVRQGTTVPLEFDFITPHAATSVVPIMRMGFAGVFINYNLGLPNACASNLLGAQCPLPVNAASTFHLDFSVTQAHPPVPTTVELSLRNHLNQNIVCGFVDFLVARQ